MENLKEYIEKRIPEAVEEGGEILTLKVEPGAFRELAVQLRNDFGFDYLVCMTGMDWGEKLGVIYHFRSTLSGENLVVKTEAFDRENPELFTVYDLWATAGLNEREIFDFSESGLSIIRICAVYFAERLGGISFAKRLRYR